MFGVVNFLLLLFTLLGRTVHLSSSQQQEPCAAMVIQQCSDHSHWLFKAVESRNQSLRDKDCKSLQATIDCLSVPRCLGNLLSTFRLYVLMTALSLSEACPHLEITTLRGYVTGIKMPCEESASNIDQCHRRCHCHDGNQVSCFRVRKQFTDMSLTERKRFIKAFKLASSSPQYQSYYEHITTLHSRIPSKFLHHMPQIFLPWHRWYLMKFENFLRQIDCRITIPYWDWTRQSEHWTQAAVWSPHPGGLGGNGMLPNNCVMNGPFQQKKFHLPWSVGGGCLKRQFKFSCPLPNLQKVRDLIQLENFTLFEQTVREQFHTKFHDCVGGTMIHHSTASFSPEFWLLHGFIDKLWADWQKKGVTFQFQYYTEISFTMPGSGQFPWEYLDQDDLPGGVRIVYENSPP